MPESRYLVVVEGKATPPPTGGTAKPFGTKPQGGADAMPVVPEEDAFLEDAEVVEDDVATHVWSGDLVDEGLEEVSDPAMAFSSFTGAEGETAWLDRADDGTLTAYVRDADGSVYRYSDVDAWAVDVDDAQMIRGEAGVEPGMEDELVEEEALPEGDMALEDGSAMEEPVDEDPLGEELPESDPDDEDEKDVPDFMQGKAAAVIRVVRPHL